MVALVDPDDADAAVRLLGEHGIEAWVAGDVAAAGVHGAGGTVTMTGAHA
jgi:phosphoribosylformylglycinamidine cyclo-ligase